MLLMLTLIYKINHKIRCNDHMHEIHYPQGRGESREFEKEGYEAEGGVEVGVEVGAVVGVGVGDHHYYQDQGPGSPEMVHPPHRPVCSV